MKSLSGFFFVLIFSITLYSQPLSTKTIDGSFADWDVSEYYVTTNGSWVYMSWDNDNIYVGFANGIASVPTTNPMIILFDTDPQEDPETGSGSTTGPADFLCIPTNLPMNVDFSIFLTGAYSGVKEYNAGWPGSHTGAGTRASGANNGVECSIPWTSFPSGVKPSAFCFTIYRQQSPNVNSDGYAFAPTGGPTGIINVNTIDSWKYFSVAATDGTVTPFSVVDTPLPVELSAFTASAKAGGVELNWTTASEVNNNRFEVERKSAGSNWVKIAQLNGAGNSSAVNSYRFFDKDASVGSYSYRLKQVDNDGKYEYSQIVEVIIVGSTELLQNFPNPFNPTTTIRFNLAENTNVKLTVYNLLGQEISVLLNQRMDAGSHNIKFDASNLISGVYLYKIEAGGYSSINKMLLIK